VFSVVFSRDLCFRPSFPTRRSSDLRPLSPTPFVALICPLWLQRFFLPLRFRLPLAAVRLFSYSASLGWTRRPNRASPLRRLPRRSEEHTSELQSRVDLVCRLLLEKK